MNELTNKRFAYILRVEKLIRRVRKQLSQHGADEAQC